MIYAMFTLTILTFVVGFLTVKARVAAVKDGALSPGYFRLMQGQDVPETVTKTTRCFNNLFEVPVLFYVVCTLYIALGIDSQVALLVAWIFVAARGAQAYIHITHNHVMHRMLSFAASVVCVLMLWIYLIMYMG
ncbi:MAPEG family protein [Aestuariirhabdus sp. Z084]|uniref:MAPEG family protein n=1 Tax=Aestuariirhabdus haliotis TaxID=2918751 RepID=UPI00201B3A4E|nr:MAPEG family protein [Aestuariirhabdus haliotis]MCL6414357.1 MAPEG family protein [Aestuariirhabdus haliotis]MCL6418289.1 MAPEG family protein [Aestuariirhabdus haliotis]